MYRQIHTHMCIKHGVQTSHCKKKCDQVLYIIIHFETFANDLFKEV
jgi:hypothetical protein